MVGLKVITIFINIMMKKSMFGFEVLNISALNLVKHLIHVNSQYKGLSFVLNKLGFREPLNSLFLSRLIREHKTYVVDVGGNVGYFPLIGLLSGAEFVEVYEPVTETYDILSKNVQFTNVFVIQFSY